MNVEQWQTATVIDEASCKRHNMMVTALLVQGTVCSEKRSEICQVHMITMADLPGVRNCFNDGSARCTQSLWLM
jgi:hypothetical protein